MPGHTPCFRWSVKIPYRHSSARHVVQKGVTIVGARPQFVKAAVVSAALRRVTTIEEVLIHTGQHYDSNMSKLFFDELL